MFGSFPENCCGVSSRNVWLSLLHFGYRNATYAAAKIDHGYVMVPFVFGYKAGSIIADPTSDQLWDTHKVRNHVFVMLGTSWDYKADFGAKANMFPGYVMNIGILKKVFPCDLDNLSEFKFHNNGSRYLEKAFKNSFSLPY